MQDDFPRWFTQRKTLDSAFLDRVWPIALGRSPDEDGRQLFLDKMSRGTSRLVVIEDLLTSVEYNLRNAADDVAFCRHLYSLILCRDPHGEDTITGWVDLAAKKGRRATFEAFCTAPEVDFRYSFEDSWDVVENLAGRVMVTFRRFDVRLTFGVQRASRPLVVSMENLHSVKSALDELGFHALSFRIVNHLENPAVAPWPS